jgi:hypothetical protein
LLGLGRGSRFWGVEGMLRLRGCVTVHDTSPSVRGTATSSLNAVAGRCYCALSCRLNVIELDGFDSSYFAGWDHSGQPPGSCSDRPCQHLYQAQLSLIARKGSYYQTSRNLYSSRLNYPAQLSRCYFLRYCPRSSLHWIQHRSPHCQHRRPHHHRHRHRLGRARRYSGRARISIQRETVFLSTWRSPFTLQCESNARSDRMFR